MFENYERVNSIFRCYVFSAFSTFFNQISQGIKAIVAEETDSDDDTETNDDVDGLILVMKKSIHVIIFLLWYFLSLFSVLMKLYHCNQL